MPVFIDKALHDHHLFRKEENDPAKALAESPKAMANCINVGLINNMPDSALVATERQLFELLNAAAGRLPVRLKLYTLPKVPRTDWGRQYMSRFYSSIDDLWDGDLDGLIVTGAEPRAPNLVEEPYWSPLGQVIDWAKENTVTAVWSCLAVHAAVLHLEGIGRHSLGDKCIGIFEQVRMLDHPLMEGVPSRVGIPHSRWNEVRGDILASSGYRILTKSADAGVDMFVKLQKKSLFVFFQGHPEYEAHSLLGEYRRDVGRFLRREIEAYPTMPKRYFDDQAEELLADFGKRALSNRRHELLAEFPVDRVAASLKNTWHSAATRIYRNWMLYMMARNTRRLEIPCSAMTRDSAISY
jgi:homoserine O-succinyltransferase/O-acetyltransferase